MFFLGPIRKLRSQGKTLPPNLERWVNTENYRQGLLSWNKDLWSCKLVGTRE